MIKAKEKNEEERRINKFCFISKKESKKQLILILGYVFFHFFLFIQLKYIAVFIHRIRQALLLLIQYKHFVLFPSLKDILIIIIFVMVKDEKLCRNNKKAS